jgi:hypothetical protein
MKGSATAAAAPPALQPQSSARSRLWRFAASALAATQGGQGVADEARSMYVQR